MDKKNYQNPTAEVVKLQPTHMIAQSGGPTQGGESGGGGSRAFNGSVEDDDDEETSLE